MLDMVVLAELSAVVSTELASSFEFLWLGIEGIFGIDLK